VCTVSPVAAIISKARNTITGYSISDFRNWPQAGRGEDEGDDPTPVCENMTG